VATIPTVRDLIRSVNPGPERASNWGKMNLVGGSVTPTATRTLTPEATRTRTHTPTHTCTVTYTASPTGTSTQTPTPSITKQEQELKQLIYRLQLLLLQHLHQQERLLELIHLPLLKLLLVHILQHYLKEHNSL